MSILKELFENIDCGSSNCGDFPSTVLKNGYQSEEEETMHAGIVKFFMDRPSPSDEEIHAFASEVGMSPEELEEEVYSILRALLKTVGKHNDVPDEDFDPEQLEMGINIEQEHTNNPYVAKMIAKDHLSEFPDYYSRLDQMETQAKDEDGIGNEDFGEEDYENDNENNTEVTFRASR